MPFDVIPAIDLRGGSVVRLRGGDFAQETAYGTDPAAVAFEFARAGARWIHVVDLDGARSGTPRHAEVIASVAAGLLAEDSRTAIEVAGGPPGTIGEARRRGACSSALSRGCRRHHSAARSGLRRRAGDQRWCRAGRGRDRCPRRAGGFGEGRRADAPGVAAEVAIGRLADAGVSVFEVTAISRDGLLEGPDLDLLCPAGRPESGRDRRVGRNLRRWPICVWSRIMAVQARSSVGQSTRVASTSGPRSNSPRHSRDHRLNAASTKRPVAVGGQP